MNRKSFSNWTRISDPTGREKCTSGYDAPVRRIGRWGVQILATGVLVATPLVAQSDAPYEFLLAESALADGDSEAALSAYDAVLREVADDPFVRLEYAQALTRLGRFREAAAQVAAARKLSPDDPEVLRTQARIAMARSDRETGATDVAREAFEALLTQQPDDLEALVSLGQIYLGAGDPDRAASVLARASEIRPGQPMIDGLLARAFLASGDAAGAERVQRSLLATNPFRLETRFDLTELLAGQGRHQEAAALLSEAPIEQVGSPELRRRRAVELFLAGDLPAAETEARSLLGETPGNPAVRLLLATLEQAEGRWQEVLDLIGPAAERAPTQDALHYLRLRALERLGRVDEALAAAEDRRAAFARAGQAAEESDARLEEANLALRLDRSARVEEILAPLLAGEEAGTRLAARLLIAEAASSAGRFADALSGLAAGPDLLPVRALRYELLLRSGNPEAEALGRQLAEGSDEEALAAADVLQRLERYAEARPLLERVVTRSASDAASAPRFRLAAVLERLGEGAEAEREFGKLLETVPDHAPALNYLGYMWIESGRKVAEGVALVERAVRLDPANGAYVDSLGWGYYQQRRFGPAVELLERAARLLPEDAAIGEHLGDAYLASGNAKRARETYERALALPGAERVVLESKLKALPGGV